MPRWRPDGPGRLAEAALDLFAEQGYEATSVEEIARRAGLTQRTFYNHFPDKREVLFGLSDRFQAEAVAAVRARPDLLPPLDRVVHALQTVCEATFEPLRPTVVRRLGVIRASRELQERELTKQATLVDVLGEVLVDSGVDRDAALLVASAALLVQQAAVDVWARPGERRTLSELMSCSLDALRRATAPG